MKRRVHEERPGWQQQVESLGLSFHSPEEGPYWQEQAHYHFSKIEIDILEAATQNLQRMAIQAAERAIRENWRERLCIPEAAWREVIASWDRDDLSLYGRFDLLWDGSGSPKLLEYNADTPTSLLEAAVIQWHWLQDRFPQDDQFNSIHEKLLESWSAWPQQTVHFAAQKEAEEDWRNLLYLEDTCRQSGKTTQNLAIESLGWSRDTETWVDEDESVVEGLFKLYPWEWMWQEAFSHHLSGHTQNFIEPVWKMLWSTKAFLVLMWETFPDHPNLLPASFQASAVGSEYAVKALHGREGANVTLVHQGKVLQHMDGPWKEQPKVYQKLHPEVSFDGWHPVLGSWIIGGEAAGLGIREDQNRITTNRSRFVPHRFSH